LFGAFKLPAVFKRVIVREKVICSLISHTTVKSEADAKVLLRLVHNEYNPYRPMVIKVVNSKFNVVHKVIDACYCYSERKSPPTLVFRASSYFANQTWRDLEVCSKDGLFNVAFTDKRGRLSVWDDYWKRLAKAMWKAGERLNAIAQALFQNSKGKVRVGVIWLWVLLKTDFNPPLAVRKAYVRFVKGEGNFGRWHRPRLRNY
jgi:hypothetical protein